MTGPVLRRVCAGRYESADGAWSIVNTARGRWTLLKGSGPGYRETAVLDICPTLTAARAALQTEAENAASAATI